MEESIQILYLPFSILSFPFVTNTMIDPEIFEPYDRLIEIEICGKQKLVPENNSILRGMQFLDMEAISYGDFCWNGECLNCQVWIMNGDKEKGVMACRTNVEEGMKIIRISDEIATELAI